MSPETNYSMRRAGCYANVVEKNEFCELFNGSNFDEVERNMKTFTVLDETYQTFTTKISTLARGFLGEILEKFILEAHEYGILESIERRAFLHAHFKHQFESKPKVLTMYMSAGFYIWLGTVGTACIVFIAEHIKFAIELKIKDKNTLKKVPKGQVKNKCKKEQHAWKNAKPAIKNFRKHMLKQRN